MDDPSSDRGERSGGGVEKQCNKIRDAALCMSWEKVGAIEQMRRNVQFEKMTGHQVNNNLSPLQNPLHARCMPAASCTL